MIIELLTMGAKLCSTMYLETNLNLDPEFDPGFDPGFDPMLRLVEEKKYSSISLSMNQRSSQSVHNNEVTDEYECECMEIVWKLQ